ncbi:outer membrane receptor protein involved in Fe transport [Pedobacter sp. UYP30]|uniref:outer membrane beta-barrel family protein n=1 Tax=Pedobacter sp. UYP30 TaxID=1756400 RepID=UPI0033948FA6
MKTYLTIVIALLTNFIMLSVHAQMVTGKVQNEKKQPLLYASVSLRNLADSTSTLQVTKENGNYLFKTVKPGKYVVRVLMVGFEKRSSEVFSVSQADVKLPIITLLDKSQTLNEVTIKSKMPVVDYKADRVIINVEKMNTAGDNALEVISKAPGIRLDKDENIILKGKTNVAVMIDGKVSYMSGTELTTYLKSLPADALSKLELISNPSASFDAASSGGYINIKLKRNRIQGFNGNANIGGGYGKYEKIYGGTNLNYNIGKLSTFARVSTGHYNSYNRLTLDRTIGTDKFNQINFWHPITQSTNYSAGFDYYVSDKQTIGASYKGFSSPDETNVTSNSPSFNAQGGKLGSVAMVNPQNNTAGNNTFNVNYRFNIDTSGRELNFDADYVNYGSSKNENFTNFYYNQNDQLIANPIYLRNSGIGGTDIYALKLDYIFPFTKTLKLETGLKTSWVNTKSNLAFDSLKNKGWVNDPRRTNLFLYNEHINAGYTSLSQSFKKLDIKIGLRLEQTIGDGNSSSSTETIRRNYWQLFPNAAISYKINDNNQLTASYRKSINRPSYGSLNPFAFYTDPYTALQGNQFLQATYSNNLEFNYTYKSFRLLTISYANTKGGISEVIYQNNDTKESISRPENLSNEKSLYFATGSPIDFFKWWNNSTELAVAYDAIKTPVQGSAYNAAKWSWGASTDNTFSLPKKYSLSMYAYYQSPSVSGLFKTLSNYAVNVGAKKTFWNDNATLALKFNDIFATGKFRSVLQYGNVNTYWQNEWENRKASLSFTYKFGNIKMKTVKSRKTSTSEEEGRVN